MSIKIVNLHASGLRDSHNAAGLLRDHLSFGGDVAEIQEIDLICNVGARVLPGDYIVYLAYVAD